MNYAELIWGKVGQKIYRRAHTSQGVRSVCYDKFTPFNPRTERQQSWRGIFSLGIRAWKNLKEKEREHYEELSKGTGCTAIGIFLKFFLRAKIRDRDLFLLESWQKTLKKMALNWAIERRKELSRCLIPENF